MTADPFTVPVRDDVPDDDDKIREVDPSREPVVLADAAAEALAGFGGEDVQMPLIPACKVKFVGMAWDSLDAVPALKEEMTFEVTGRVIGHGTIVLKSGETRETATIDVTSVKQV